MALEDIRENLYSFYKLNNGTDSECLKKKLKKKTERIGTSRAVKKAVRLSSQLKLGFSDFSTSTVRNKHHFAQIS